MPKFEKSTGYKMSGPSWYGGNSGSPMKQKSSGEHPMSRYVRETKTYGKRPEPSPETTDYYEGQTKKTTTKGKLKALGRVLVDPNKSYKAEKKKERQKAYTKGKKPPSEYETVKYVQKQPRTSTTPQR
jgi:hypothetical protein